MSNQVTPGNNPLAYVGAPEATQQQQGIIEIASVAETIAGIVTDKAVTPFGLSQINPGLVPDASTAVKGIIQIATNGEAVAGGAGDLALVPSNLSAVFASPPPVGSVAPNTGTFTTLTATNFTLTNPLDVPEGGTGLASITDHAVLLGSGVAAITPMAVGTNNQIIIGQTAADPVWSNNLDLPGTLDVTGVSTFDDVATFQGAVTINAALTVDSVVIDDVTYDTDAITSTAALALVATTTMDLDSGTAISLNSSGGVINIGDDAVSQNMNIGTAGTRAIVIGNSTATTSVAINGGTGSSVNIGTNAIAHTVTIGNIIGATAVAINTGTGGLTVTTTGAGDIVLASADTVLIDSAGVLELNSSAGVISIGNDAVAQNINLGTDGARTITIGNIVGATALVLNSGTGGVAINTTGAGDFVVTSADTVLIDSAGVLELNSSAGVISIGNDAVAQNINIGTGGAARTITIGNGTGTTSIVVNCGTGAASFAANATDHTTTIGSVTGTSLTAIKSGTGGITLGSGSTVLNAASTGEVTLPLQPSFLAYLSASALNKTGNGATYTLGTDVLSEVFDRGSDFNVNGTFTAPVTGLYNLHAQVTITGATIATTYILSIVTTARTYQNTFIKAAGSEDETVQITALADMTATDTATVTITVSGEAGDTDDIKGGATLETYFCGWLVA